MAPVVLEALLVHVLTSSGPRLDRRIVGGGFPFPLFPSEIPLIQHNRSRSLPEVMLPVN